MEGIDHAPGTFCWVELTTTDATGAKNLYNKLFGWDYVDNPMGPDMVYTMCELNGKHVGALYEMHDPNVPPHWSLYVRVENANASAARAKELGGNVVMEPFDVAEHGRMAIIADPSGAVFHLWEPNQHAGYEAVGVPGTHCWSELLTSDTAKAKAFYGALFGWVPDESMGEYTMFTPGGGGEAIAGMMGITPEMGPVPPNWSPYFFVASADTAVDTASASGARVLHGPTDVPDMVRFATIMDPSGAVFGVFHPLGNPQG